MIPKFRAWDKRINKWFDDEGLYSVVLDHTGDMYILESGKYFHDGDFLITSWATGLTDLNGTEIYEDDIVKMQFRVYDEPELFVVKTKAGRAARVDNGHKGTELWLRHRHCEVVGNRWENPELMEGFE